MAYTKQVWLNTPNQTTPLSAQRLNHLETQYDEAVAVYQSTLDLNVSSLFEENSLTRAVTGNLYGNTPYVSHSAYNFSGALVDEWEVHTGGLHYEGLLERGLASGVTNPTSTSSFRTVKQFSRQSGVSLVSNGSGWVTSGTPRIRGANIYKGVAYGSLSNVHIQDNACVAYCRDGKLRYYEAALGQSASLALSDGAIHSWSWGPAIYKDGAPFNYAGTGGWSGLNTVAKSARTILAQKTNGNILLFQVYGETGVSGLTIGECVSLMGGKSISLSVVLDGGGSTSSSVNGDVFHPSSDTSSRALPDFISFNLPIHGGFGYSSTPVPLSPGFGGSLFISSNNGTATLTGSVSGTVSGSSGTQVAPPSSIPPWVKSGGGLFPVLGSDNSTGVLSFQGGVTVYPSGSEVQNPKLYAEFNPTFGLN